MKKLLCGSALLLLCATVWGQDFRATITGLVSDTSKSVIPNAKVKATNAATNVSSSWRSRTG